MDYERYRRLVVRRPADRVLEVTMTRPERLNAADAVMHRELVSI